MQYSFDVKQYLKNTWPIYLTMWLLTWGVFAIVAICFCSGDTAAIGIIGCFAFIVTGLVAINRVRTWRSSRLTISRNQIVFRKTIEDGYEGEIILGRRYKFKTYSITTDSIFVKSIGNGIKITGNIICEEENLKSGHYSKTQKEQVRGFIIPPYWEDWDLRIKKYILDLPESNLK